MGRAVLAACAAHGAVATAVLMPYTTGSHGQAGTWGRAVEHQWHPCPKPSTCVLNVYMARDRHVAGGRRPEKYRPRPFETHGRKRLF
jgi:hypothetical protein